MKKIMLIGFTMFATTILLAQTENVLPTGVQVTPEGVSTPVIVINKFKIDYPNAEVIWQMEGDNYVAQYTDETTNTKNSVVYDEDGNLIRRDKEVNDISYPKTITDYYRKNYPNENFVVWESIDNTGNKWYYIKRKSIFIWFDKTGKLTSEKTKS